MVLCFSQLGDWISSSFGKLETKLGKQLEERLIPRWNLEFLSHCEPPHISMVSVSTLSCQLLRLINSSSEFARSSI